MVTLSNLATKLTSLVQEKIAASELATSRGAHPDATQYLYEALAYGDTSPDLECSIRCALAKSLEAQTEYREALDALIKYENPEEKELLSPLMRGEVNLRFGWTYSWLGEQPKAIALLNQALKEFREIDYETGIGEAYLALGRTYVIEIEEYKIARDYLQKALEHLRRTGSPIAIARTYLRLGLVDYQEGDLITAKKYFIEAISLAEDSHDHTLLGALMINLASIYFDLCQTEEAAQTYYKAIDHLHLIGHNRLLGVAYGNLGKNLMRTGNWEEAQRSLECGLALSKMAGNSTWRDQGTIYQTLGYLQYQQEFYDEARKNLESSIELLSPLKTKTHLAESYRYLALVAAAQNSYEDAFNFAKKSLQLTFGSNVARYSASSYLILAQLHLERKEYHTADDFLRMAKGKLEKDGDLELSGYAQRVYGRLRTVAGDLHAARSAMAQSLSIFNTIKSLYHSARSSYYLGDILYKLGDLGQAEIHLQSAEMAFLQLDAKTPLKNTQELLAKVSSEIRNTPETAQPMPVSFDRIFVERLIEAAHQRELLLRELISITRDLFAASTVIIFEINEAGDFVPVVTQGTANTNFGRLGERIRIQLDGGNAQALPPETVLQKFSDRTQKQMLLYAVAGQPPDNYLLGHLQTIVHLAEQGLEIYALRERTKTTREFDPASLRCLASMPGFLAASPAIKMVLEQIHKIRSSTVTVLITGESGTGKELVARAVHLESQRHDCDFVPFNCAAVAKDIVESRLFGHRKGAFTGATHDQRGVVRAAEGGTLFLDEVGELPIDIQPKLLRFLQEGEIHALGDDKPLRVDVRVIAATNRDLEKQVNQGLFREDLFHRLNVIRIHVPPLRERREEILPLAENFLKKFADRAKKSVKLSEEAADKLVAYDWPGNVRQLQNEMERIVAYAEEQHVATIDELSIEIINFKRTSIFSGGNINSDGKGRITIPPGVSLADAVDALEKQMVSEALKRHNGNISRTARQLGLTRKGLQLKRSRLGV